MVRSGRKISAWRAGRRGQTMVEFATVLAMILASLAVLVVFLFTFKEYGGRILDLAASEYP